MTHLSRFLFLSLALPHSLFLLYTEDMVDLMIVSETSSVYSENSKSVHTPAVEGSSERIVRLFSYHPLELIIIIIIIINNNNNNNNKNINHTHTHTHTHTHNEHITGVSLTLELGLQSYSTTNIIIIMN